jgi:hypothetical protein
MYKIRNKIKLIGRKRRKLWGNIWILLLIRKKCWGSWGSKWKSGWWGQGRGKKGMEREINMGIGINVGIIIGESGIGGISRKWLVWRIRLRNMRELYRRWKNK